jgi:hypothetical protein
MKIAGKRSDTDWTTRLNELATDSSPAKWLSVYDDFFHERIRTRYLDPIKAIEGIPEDIGKSFAIVALVCTLLEFIQGCRDGLNFKADANDAEPNVYGLNTTIKGKTLFNRCIGLEPFKSALGEHRKTFYRDVRCGLLHEARTCGGWVIKPRSPDGKKLVENVGDKHRLYRDRLVSVLEEHLSQYRTDLSNDPGLQTNFKLKWEHLCKK